MAAKDNDGMTRVDLEWTIEGSKKHGTRSGKMYGLHEGELEAARKTIKSHARKGDTVTIKTF